MASLARVIVSPSGRGDVPKLTCALYFLFTLALLSLAALGISGRPALAAKNFTAAVISTIVVVPEVTRLTPTAAEEALAKAGLKMTVVDRVSGKGGSDYVAKQDPSGGTRVPRGSEVEVVVALATSTVRVPELIGKETEYVVAAIKKARLSLEWNFIDPRGSRPTAVVRQSPQAGTRVPLSSLVSAWTTLPPAIVPDVTKLTPKMAEGTLAKAGLKMVVVDRVSGKGSSDHVAKQDPSGGTRVPRGSEVEVVVVLGTPTARVPELIGMRIDEAAAALKVAGLSLETTSIGPKGGPDAKVVRQSPKAGTRVRLNSLVRLWTKAPPAIVPQAIVPPLIGESPEAAEKLLADAGLGMMLRKEVPSNRPRDTVVRQSHKSGTEVPRGTLVGVVVALAQPLVTVPDVTGLERNVALEKIRARGLTPTIARRLPGKSPVDQVRQQDPLAGSKVPVGSEVALIIAVAPALVEVPDVAGLGEVPARVRLERSGLRMTIGEWVETEADPDKVAWQKPSAGTWVRPKTLVEVRVTRLRPAPDPVSDPPEPVSDPVVEEPPAPESVEVEPITPLPEPRLFEGLIDFLPTWLRGQKAEMLRLVWGFGIAALLLALVLAAKAVKSWLAKDPPALRMVATKDLGLQQVEALGRDDTLADIRFRPRLDPGLQSVELTEPSPGGPGDEEVKRYA